VSPRSAGSRHGATSGEGEGARRSAAAYPPPGLVIRFSDIETSKVDKGMSCEDKKWRIMNKNEGFCL
jgi:hypothetical protein